MRVVIKKPGLDSEEIAEIDKVLAATEAFPYWAFWYPDTEDGKSKVRFIHTQNIMEVLLEEDIEPAKLASVTPINREDDVLSDSFTR